MSSTSTVFVNPFVEDTIRAERVLGPDSTTLERRWFAYVMPLLRENMRGIAIATLARRLGPHGGINIHAYVSCLFKAGVIRFGYAGDKQVAGYYGFISLSPDYWLKETAERQALPCCEVYSNT